MSDLGLALLVFGNLIGGYVLVSHVLRGAGRVLAFGVGILLGALAWGVPIFGKISVILIIFGLIFMLVWENQHRKGLAHSQLVFEGGGIRRGLTPVEVGALLDLNAKAMLAIAVTTLLQKGILERVGGDLRGNPQFQADQETINPKQRTEERKNAARQKSQVLSAEEDMLLELFWQQNSFTSAQFPISLWRERVTRECDEKLGGYDRAQTKIYYSNFMTHRFEGVEKGFFPREEFVPWMVLEFFANTQDEAFIEGLIQKTRPAWLHEDESLVDWAESFRNLRS